MSSKRSDPNSLFALRKKLQGISFAVASAVARRGAAAVTMMARTSYVSGENVYGDGREAGKGGAFLSLIKSGDTLKFMFFEPIGASMRCSLGTPYAKYLIGKYTILPHGGVAMPVKWKQALDRIMNEEAGRETQKALAA